MLDETVFHPAGGGQPGDSGRLAWKRGKIAIATAVRAGAAPAPLPPVGATAAQALDRDRRHAHMRVHTALHLLPVALSLPVIGGATGAGKGRLGFDMPEAPAGKAALEARSSALIDLQPCGGTHVARTAETGRVRLGRIEKMGRRSRRVSLCPDGWRRAPAGRRIPLNCPLRHG